MNTDQVEIEDDDALLRRVPDNPDLVKRKGAVVRPSSVAFKPSDTDGGISVDVRRLLDDPTDPLAVLDGLPTHGLVELRASVVRDNGHTVHHAPLDGNPAHANIILQDGLDKKEQARAQRELALASAWIREPAQLQP